MRRDRFTKIACFTEDVKSLYMWDQYADGYKGYALEYDFTNYLLQGCLACPKQQGCEQENKNYSNLFPVIYSEKRYDATNNVINIILREVMENTKAKIFIYQLISCIGIKHIYIKTPMLIATNENGVLSQGAHIN